MSMDKCPFGHGQMKADAVENKGKSNMEWWPKQVRLDLLEQQSEKVNPMGKEFNYKTEFEKINFRELKEDLYKLMTDSKDWWPADYGHYGPFFIRMAWHSAGTYRALDGRGGARTGSQRFAPLNSWPDNANLDKARRLLWPIKQKYGKALSWADLMILAGNCALESMGFKTFGFGGGREDIWEPEADIYWGSEDKWFGDERYSEGHQLEKPLAAVQMGLIYVNPEGPGGVPDAVASAKDVRETFRRMGMTDEETVALIAGGHTFGKCHGAVSADYIGAEPEAGSVENMGFGWANSYGSGVGDDTYTSGIEGPWNSTPTKWDMGYLNNLFDHDWNLVKSPAGAYQWVPADESAHNVPKAHNKDEKQAPIMTTADLSLRMDPEFKKIALRYKENPQEFEEAFARAWFKLTHRDMGPKSRYLGPEVPTEDLIWQDPIPKSDYEPIDENDVIQLKAGIRKLELTPGQLVSTAWASASTFRTTDLRGGANGARLLLEPQKSWEVNRQEKICMVLEKLQELKNTFDKEHAPKKVSMADLIVLAGNVGVEDAISNAGFNKLVDFKPGRTDALQEMTDTYSFNLLKPAGDPFINYRSNQTAIRSEDLMVDKAVLLGLDIPELVALMGGMRVIGANYQDLPQGVFTDKVGALTNDFFVNLLDMNNKWEAIDASSQLFKGVDRTTGVEKWQASKMDLILGSNARLRAVAEVYGSDDGGQQLVDKFVEAWNKVMNADRFDLK